MSTPLNQVLFPASLPDVFTVWTRFPNAIPYAGGTNITGKPEIETEGHPPVYICLDKIEELHRITRTEHYLEIGAMTKLNRLISLGKIVPEVIRSCLIGVAGVQVRNIATIGGNICCKSRLLDLPAPLAALDAQYELRNSQTIRWVSASRFHNKDESTTLGKNELLTRIRLPLHQWNYAVYKKFYCENYLNSESLVFLAKTEKNILSEIRVFFKENVILRNKSGESLLNGNHLPLNRKIADEFIQNWRDFLNKYEISEFSKNSLLNSIEENVYNLTE